MGLVPTRYYSSYRSPCLRMVRTMEVFDATGVKICGTRRLIKLTDTILTHSMVLLSILFLLQT